MAKINPHYQKLQSSYLFPRIQKKKEQYLLKHSSVIDLGVGDITKPLVSSIVTAISKAAKEMGQSTIGYGPSTGYDFLKKAIIDFEYKNLPISTEEIFISDGAKCDTANIQEIFSSNSIVALSDPSYPVYVDSTVMNGKTKNIDENGRYEGIVYLPSTKETNFVPHPPDEICDLIYLCSPNNPTGIAMSKELLKKWVDYATKNQAVILFDAAYESFITSSCPKSIYEIEGADKVAIEIKSFSKSAGFSGLRCSYTIVPKALELNNTSLNALWKRRCETKFGGCPYPIQKGAEAIYSMEGRLELQQNIKSYQSHTALLREGLKDLGYTVFGGIDAPYIWCKTPSNLSSWEFFDLLLDRTGIIGIPGSGFGKCGEGYFRFSCFADKTKIEKALELLNTLDYSATSS